VQREKFENQIEKLRKDAEFVILHRNKIVALHDKDYNSKLGDWSRRIGND